MVHPAVAGTDAAVEQYHVAVKAYAVAVIACLLIVRGCSAAVARFEQRLQRARDWFQLTPRYSKSAVVIVVSHRMVAASAEAVAGFAAADEACLGVVAG